MRPMILCFLVCLLGLAGAENPSWMRYPAISPDGSQIAFSYGGDLYTVPSKGGVAVALTQHVAYDYMPVWSPDGKMIAFASDRYGNDDVYVISSEGGKATQLTFHSGVDVPSSFSPSGSEVLFSSARLDAVESLQMPNWRMGELYSVPTTGGRVQQILTTATERAVYGSAGERIYYQDKKGYEDPWRKHHHSSVTRDIWSYEVASKKHTKLTAFDGEDRNPVEGDEGELFFLSERGGSFNVWVMKDGGEARPLTNFDRHPVRFLSRAENGVLCFGYHGEIYTLAPDGSPEKVALTLRVDQKKNVKVSKPVRSVTEAALSPDGKELAFVSRGEIFVTSLEHDETKRITSTPEQERSVSWHPEGEKLLYASERGGSWNLYTTELAREGEESFHLATTLKEEVVLEGEEESFQPLYSPDGKLIAFIEERNRLVVLEVGSGEKRTLLDGSRGYSYSDGDLQFSWSPDSKWIAANYLPQDRWVDDIVILAADGKSEPVNVTLNGYYDSGAEWTASGEAIYWYSNRYGRRPHGGWGSEQDVMALFLTSAAYREFKQTESERAAEEEGEDDEEKEDEDEKEVIEVKIDFDDLEDRTERLTKFSGMMTAAQLSDEVDALYYLTEADEKQELWWRDLHDDDMEVLASFPSESWRGSQASIELSKDGETLVVLAGGELFSVSADDGEKDYLEYDAQIEVDHVAERAHLFEHVWRQVKKKFYRSDLHGVDWDLYRSEYEKLLPHVHNNRDFADLLGEMLGELNASHTGGKYRSDRRGRGESGSLGIFHDWDHEGPGIRILEVMDRGPLAKLEAPAGPGVIIEKIDGEEISARENHYVHLWQKVDERVLLSFFDSKKNKRWEEVVRPVSLREESELAYHRWLERMREETDRLSGGKIGYVHIRGMNDGSFREFYGEVFGRHGHKKALVVDTRFNGGGWLTEDLTAFLTGVDYLRFYPREQGGMGGQPMFRWAKPSAVIMGEGNYSDAHMFPFAYKTMGIGKLIGMPVPGTATAVWWERLMDPEIIFGIPQVGMVDRDGVYMENTQLEPDIRVEFAKEDAPQAKDPQLEAAVEHLLSLPDPEEWKFPEPEQ